MNRTLSQQKIVRTELIICFVLVILTLIIYVPVTDYDFITYDDNGYISDNDHVREGLTLENIKWSFLSFYAANWHPVTWLSHMLDCQLYGLDPGKHHTTNLIFHILNTLLLFFIFFRTTSLILPSAFIAAFFSLHPMHVESVAWIAERKDVLCTFFMMISFMFYISYTKSKNRIFYWSTFLFFVLGIMSKPMIITMPFLMLLFDYWPLKRLSKQYINNSLINRRILFLFVEKIPFFICSFFSGYITIIAQGKSGAIVELNYLPFYMRFCNAVIQYVEYIKKMFCPFNLSIFYPYPQKIDWLLFCVSLSVIVSISLVAFFLMKKHPWLITGWLWYTGTLVPVIGLIQVGHQAMADRYTYIPYIGLFSITVFSIYNIFSRLLTYGKHAGFFVLFLLLLFWGTVSSSQVKLWKNTESIFTHSTRVTPDNFIAHLNLGNYFLYKHQIKKAVIHLSKASILDPKNAGIYLHLGICYATLNDYPRALEYFFKAIELKPSFVHAYYNIGCIYLNQEHYHDALDYFIKTIKIDSNNANAYYGIGLIYSKHKDYQNALIYLRKAYESGSSEAEKEIKILSEELKKQNLKQSVNK